MSLNTRYIIILTLVLVVFLGLFALAPTLTGLSTYSNNHSNLKCENSSDYNDCIQCCQNRADNSYGKQYYGTEKWNEAYTKCWDNYCITYAKY